MKSNQKFREPKPNLKHKRPQRKTQSASLDKDNPFRELPRIRTLKPEFFVHLGLFDAERAYGLPLRVAFMGLMTCCDRKGCFRWQPRQLKLYTLPYDEVDMSLVLELLEEGFIQKYEYQGQGYGVIPSFLRHQKITHTEPESPFPSPEESFFELEPSPQKGGATQKNRVNETHFDCPFSPSLDKNLELETNSVDANFEKNRIKNSSKSSHTSLCINPFNKELIV